MAQSAMVRNYRGRPVLFEHLRDSFGLSLHFKAVRRHFPRGAQNPIRYVGAESV